MPRRQTTKQRLVAAAMRRNPAAARLLRFGVRHGPAGVVPAGLNRTVIDTLRELDLPFCARMVPKFVLHGSTGDFVQRHLYLYGIWEPNLSRFVEERLRPGDVFIDVGANCGYFSMLAATRVQASGRVVAVEASPSIARLLVRNVGVNGLTTIRVAEVAAADEEASLTFWRGPGEHLGCSSIFPGEGFVCEGVVQARRLADILLAEELGRARLVKIDVEGAELRAMRGLMPALPQMRPDLELVVEVAGGPDAADPRATAEGLIALLAPHGFRAYRLDNDYTPDFYLHWRERGRRPERLNAPVDAECDLVFSRIDAETL